MFEVLMCDSSIRFASSKDELTVPELMGSSFSCSSLDSSVSSTKSLYQSCNGGLDSSFKSTSSGKQPAFLNSGFFKKKQAKAAKKIQAAARGFIVRVQICKAPILAELADIQRRKDEELERIELGKKEEMEAFRQQMESELNLLKEAVAEAKHLVTHLNEEKVKYEKENSELKQACKSLKKANKQLMKDGKKGSDKNVEKAMAEQRIANLKRQTAQRQEVADKYLNNISVYEQGIKEADNAAEEEKRHARQLKACISGVLDLVKPKSAPNLTKKLLQITNQNNVHL